MLLIRENSVSLIVFVGADPEQRQARNNGTKFAVLSVATQRSWKNAQDGWSSKVEWHRACVIWNMKLRQECCLGAWVARCSQCYASRRTLRGKSHQFSRIRCHLLACAQPGQNKKATQCDDTLIQVCPPAVCSYSKRSSLHRVLLS